MALTRLARRPSLLSTDDVDKLYHHFLQIDEDGNGVISREEFMKHPSVVGNPLANRLLELMDTDRSGDINFSEFVASLSIFSSRSSSVTKMKFAFNIYDLDGDGFISNGELFLVLRMMTGDQLKADQLQQIVDNTIRDADKDKDGKLSFQEFMTASTLRNAELIRQWNLSDL